MVDLYIYSGSNYIAYNGRWKKASAADVYTLAVMGVPVNTYTVPSAADWTNLQHTLGAPGPL